MKDATTAQLLADAREAMSLPEDPNPFERVTEGEMLSHARSALHSLIEVVERQDARIAALEAARAPHGPPLEGTGPLPLERKGG